MTNIFITRDTEEEFDELKQLQQEESDLEFEQETDYNEYFKTVTLKLAEHYAILLENFVGRHKCWREIQEKMEKQIERFGAPKSLINAAWFKKHGKIIGYEILYQQLKNNASKNNTSSKSKQDSRIVKMRLPNS